MPVNHRNTLATIFPSSNSHLLMDQTIDANFRFRMNHDTIRVRSTG